MPKGSLKLHPEFGVNPTIPVCYWCGEDTGQIALMGAYLKGEAPARMVVDKQPCEACQKRWADGVVIMEAGFLEPHEPTGRHIIARREVVRDMITDDTIREKVLAEGKMKVSADMFRQLTGEGRLN